MSEPLLALENVNSYYGESHILKSVSLHVGEGETRTEIRVPGIVREHRAGDAVQLGLDEAERSGSRCAEDPFDVSGHTENARAIGFVGQAKA